MDIVPKNTGDSLTAAEFNQIVDELENVIVDGGQTPNASILTQLASSIINLISNGQFYEDSGIADAYLLTKVAPREGITELQNGQHVRFIADNANTGAATANVNALGVRDIKVFNPGGPSFDDPAADDIGEDTETELRYDQAQDFWVIISSAGVTSGGGGGGGAVDSVFGRTGAVVAASGDYDCDEIDNVSTVSGATVCDALDTLAVVAAGFESGQQAIVNGTLISVGHSLGQLPKNFSVELECVVADHGYSVGERVRPDIVINTDSSNGTTASATPSLGSFNYQASADASNVNVVVGFAGFLILNKNTGIVQLNASTPINNTNWRIRLKANL